MTKPYKTHILIETYISQDTEQVPKTITSSKLLKATILRLLQIHDNEQNQLPHYIKIIIIPCHGHQPSKPPPNK